MKAAYKLIKTTADMADMCEHLKTRAWVGFDIETTDLDPFNGVIRLIQLSDGETTYIVDIRDCPDLEPMKELLTSSQPRKIAHNAKFDTKWVRHHLDVEVEGIFCTYFASRLLAGGDADKGSQHPHSGHRLLDVVERYLGITLDKTQQLSDWSVDELDPAQLEYAARDANVLVPLKDKIWSELEANGLLQVAELENECIVPVIQMELNGFLLDKQEWLNQLQKVQVQHRLTGEELAAELGQHFPQPSLLGIYDINLDSQQQVMDAMKWAGVPMPDTTEEWKLQPLVDRYPVVGKLLDYRGLAKAISSYGDGWFDHIKPQTGRIHAEFNPLTAKTGRFGCSKPNLQQIPAESEYRWCFKAAPGNKLVIADYSQIELRILADRSEDEKFIAAFKSGHDLHTATASQVFGVAIEYVTPDQRSFAKRLNFGLVYGISAKKLSALIGITKEEAEDLMKKYFGTFTGVNQYIRDTRRQAIVDRECRTGSGRLMRLRFDDDHGGDVAGAQRLGVNMPIQGTSADILKRALRLLHDSIRGTSARLVNIVHDEIVVECAADEEAEWAAETLRRSMVTAGEEFISRVPVVVDVKTAEMWKK